MIQLEIMKLLLIEDDQHLGRAVARGLKQAGHNLDWVQDGEEGLDLAASGEYDLAIIDWMLPGLSGPEICRELLAQKVGTPTLMLTAKDRTEELVEGLDAGADDYLVKPFKFAELLARIRALGRRPAQANPTRLRLDRLELDPAQGLVTYQGRPLDLTKQEFNLMEFFARHPNRVFSTQELLEKVWPFSSDVTINAVQVYIGYLRKKLAQISADAAKILQTVRGFGYQLQTSTKS